MSAHLARGRLLLEQGRHALAEEEIRRALAEDPDSPDGHALLAVCLAERKEYTEATEEAKRAVHLAPDHPFPHFVLAQVLVSRNRLEEAEPAAREAVRLDPTDATNHALVAQIRLGRRDWTLALEAANEGLAMDAEDIDCINARAVALVKLGRKSEAGETLQGALAHAPESSPTHANQGWAYLDQSDPKKALHHFREALRLDPENGWARAGIVEALKARNPVYALMLRYFLWMGKLSDKARWGVILGAYFGHRILMGLQEANPALQPFLFPVTVVYIGFALLTWISYPLFNLMLRLSPTGRLALTRDQTIGANWVGLCLFLGLGSLGWWLATDEGLAFFLLLTFGLLLLPLSGVFACPSGYPRRMMAAFTLGLLAVRGAHLAIALTAVDPSTASIQGPLSWIFFLGVLLSGFVANALMTARPKR